MGARTGEQFLEGLRKTRRIVWVGDERVDDVTTHPALAQAARTLAGIYDRQHRFPDECLIADPATGELVNVSHMIPRSVADLQRRNRGLSRISEATVGLMGRTPDYMNVKFACFAARHTRWAGADGGNAEGAERLVRFQRRLARDDLSLTHTIIQPTIDKTSDPRVIGNQVTLHKVGETAGGIVVRGARILATLAPFADEIAVYPGLAIPDGAEVYALAFAIPVDTPGLIFVCRDSASAPGAHRFNRPLSSRFDEQDAFVIFDDVEIPEERIFIDGRVDVYNDIRSTGIMEPGDAGDAGGASELRRGDAERGRAVGAARTACRRWGMVSRSAAPDPHALAPCHVVPPGRRDHHPHRKPQPPRRAEPGATR